MAKIQKKILLIDRYFYPDLQATSVLLTDLVSQLAKDFEFEILCGPPSNFKNDLPPPITLGRAKITTLPVFQFNNPSFPERFLNYISFLMVVPFAILFSEKPDLIITQSSPPLLPFVVMLACWVRRLPFIYICQDFFPGTATRSGALKESVLTGFFELLHKWVVKRACKIVVIGRDMKEVLMKTGVKEEKIEVISNWANLSEIFALPKKNSFSLEHRLSENFIVMHAGNFGYVQDFDFLLDMAAELRNFPKIKWVFVGNGSLASKIRKKAEAKNLSNVIFISFAPREKLSEVLGSADCHVVSLKKGLAGYSVPSKTYSILASARPVIGLVERESEVAKLIEEANCGIVLDHESAQKAADAIRKLSEDTELVKFWGLSARSFSERMDFRTRAVHQYRLLLETCLESAK